MNEREQHPPSQRWMSQMLYSGNEHSSYFIITRAQEIKVEVKMQK